jgi:SAM-dependent methyltransferase
MLDNIAGVRLAEFHNLVSTRYRMTHPQLWMTLALDRYLQRSVGAKDRVRRLSERAMATVDRATRRRFLQRLRRRLGAVRFSTQPDPWTRYYGEIDPEFDRQLKLETVRRLLREDRPKSVLDLGCNTGVFALEAARTGARTIAVDSSEACVDGLYLAARAENLPLTPLVADVLCPTPAYGFLSRQYPDLYSRVRSDLVLCLGLMHHLVVAGRQSLERIAEIIAMASRDKAIFEYVGPDDANMPHLSGRRDISYSAEDVIKALAKHFTRIERMPSDRPTRELLHCQR